MLFDLWSGITDIAFLYAEKIGIRPTRKLRLDNTTIGNVATTIPSSVYKTPLVSLEF